MTTPMYLVFQTKPSHGFVGRFRNGERPDISLFMETGTYRIDEYLGNGKDYVRSFTFDVKSSERPSESMRRKLSLRGSKVTP